jgi:hypothetical protein
MRNCYCPNCGALQRCKIKEPSKIVLPCHVCARSLMVKAERDELLIRVKPPDEKRSA